MAVIASVSGLNIAQPDLATTFDASQTQVLWFINIYPLSLAALLLPLDALGDRWGRKPMFLPGLLVFGVASALAGLAWSSGTMLAARLLSGIGAAMIMPITLAAITSALPRDRQGVASALNDVTRELGTALGVALLGAVLSAGYRHEIEHHLAGLAPEIAATAREGVANAVAISEQAGAAQPPLVLAAQNAFVAG